MDVSMGEWRKSANVVLIFVVFCTIAAAGFSYLYVKKPALNISIDVAIVVSFVCGFAALFFFFRSIMSIEEKTGQKEQEVARGYQMGSEEPFGC